MVGVGSEDRKDVSGRGVLKRVPRKTKLTFHFRTAALGGKEKEEVDRNTEIRRGKEVGKYRPGEIRGGGG